MTSLLYFISLGSKTQVNVGVSSRPIPPGAQPQACPAPAVMSPTVQPLESSLHLSGASPAGFWQEVALCSGAKAWLGRAGTGISLRHGCYVPLAM